MKINSYAVKSALRHFAVTAAAVLVAKPDADWKALLAGVAAAVVGPAIRAWDKNDPTFGRISDELIAEIDRAFADWAEVEKPKKKAVKKK